jgi:hypothetical protein
VTDATAGAIIGLAALVCLVIAESRPDRSTPAPPLLALAVVAPIAAFPQLLPFGVSSPLGAVTLATVAGFGFLVVVARPPARAAWITPVLVLAACLGRAWGILGRLGAPMFCIVMIAALFVAGAWGPLPWPSRLVGPRSARARRAPRRVTLLGLGIGAVAIACVTVAMDGTPRVVGALTTTALLEVEVAMAAFAVRIWRFAPRRRVADVVTLVVIGSVALGIYLPLALDALAFSIVFAALCVIAAGIVAWPLAVIVSTEPSDRVTREPQGHQQS